jgi:hypothetical protein
MTMRGMPIAQPCSRTARPPGQDKEALKHIYEVVHMVMTELLEDGEQIPEDVQISLEPRVSVTV